MHVINPLLSYPILLAYFVGADNYTWVYFRNGKRQLLAKPLVYFEQRLPDFIRIHKTALVNPAFVADIQPPPRPKMAATVQLQDGTVLPVSRRRWPTVLATLQPPAGPTGMASETDPSLSEAMPPISIYAVLEGDGLLLTRHCLDQLGLRYDLHVTKAGDSLVQALRRLPEVEWPVLLLIDARRDRANCLSSLDALKRDPHLRAIPIIWLNAQSDCSDQVYQLNANSVVALSEQPDALVRALTQLFQYWLFVVQLPTYNLCTATTVG